MGQEDADLHSDSFTPRAFTALSSFGIMLKSWRDLSNEIPPLGLMDRILADTEYRIYIDDGSDEGSDRWENIMEMRRLAAEYQDRSLSEFLEEIALVSDQDTYDENINAPTLLTLHAAKGLEFPVVFIVGLVDGTLPHMRSLDDPDSMEEERRLLYVGITRAMDRLYLIFTQSRSAFGYQEPCDPSRFLEDIPNSMFEQTPTRSGLPFRSIHSQPQTWQAVQSSSNAASRSLQYQAGIRVEHPVFGEGMVLNSKLQDDDEVVDIFFEKVGLKKLVASLARLEIKE